MKTRENLVYVVFLVPALLSLVVWAFVPASLLPVTGQALAYVGLVLSVWPGAEIGLRLIAILGIKSSSQQSVFKNWLLSKAQTPMKWQSSCLIVGVILAITGAMVSVVASWPNQL